MEFGVSGDPTIWDSHLEKFSPRFRDIYFSRRYHHLYETIGDGTPFAAFLNGENGSRIFYPFMRKSIKSPDASEPCFDIATAYGYGGPLAENHSDADLRTFETRFHQWCMETRVVSEFIRFHPLLGNEALFRDSIVTEFNRPTVCVPLEYGIERLWDESLSSKTRNMVRKGRKAGLTARVSRDFGTFVRIYHATMDLVQADKYYYFPPELFRGISLLTEDQMVLFEAIFEQRVVSSAIFLLGKTCIHYHLSGNDPAFRHLAPNDFLLYNVMEWGCAHGFEKLHLGGGATTSKDDTLLKFKQGFSRDLRPYTIGKRVHLPEMYAHLMEGWKRRTNQEPKLFQQYNAREQKNV